MNLVEIMSGQGPIVLGIPHSGTYLPPEIFSRLSERGQKLIDTDWHVDQLYRGLLDGVTSVRANFHRYLIDANRDPSGQSLYPGQNTTGLVPLTDFDGNPLWVEPPTPGEIEERRAGYHTTYHTALRQELERVRKIHGLAILFDCHSIRSRIPFLFEGQLPDFNIGTNNCRTCAPQISSIVSTICERATGFTCVTNGRFKGGWTTRNYGRPTDNIHAIQMELSQSTYLKSESMPFELDTEKTDLLRVYLKQILQSLVDLAPSLGQNG